MPPVIHWFRRDLRLSDNTALSEAARLGQPILPVFIFDPAILESPRVGLPRLAFLLHALNSLDATLRQRGSRLLRLYGDPRRVLPALVEAASASAVYLNRDYSPFARRRDDELARSLTVPLHCHDDVLLLPPGSVLTDAGKPYTVFSPFKKKWLTLTKSPLMDGLPASAFVAAEIIASYALEGRLNAEAPLSLATFNLPQTIAVPQASESVAQARLTDFLQERVYAYGDGRDQLAAQPGDDTRPSTSFLSPYLRFGLLSPRQAYWGAREAYQPVRPAQELEGVETWVSELVWRDFYGHILYHFPHVLAGNFKPAYDQLEWRDAPDEFRAWQDGMTGYPVVDAAMRQLKAMGWMPNRARMIVASFLTKDLLIDWRRGERHFMDWLIDGDPAANNGGWQWSASTGTDAQPYFRIFNPLSQSEKFDPDGVYIRRWLPELRGVATAYIHAPWTSPTPPRDYPPPIVDHAFARDRTLAAFKQVGG